MINWFRVPLYCGGRLNGDHKASKVEATVDLLGRWHQGENPSIAELKRAWVWSWDRVDKLVGELLAWGSENDAVVPTGKTGSEPGGRDGEAGRQKKPQTSGNTEESGEIGQATGSASGAPCARGSLLERERLEREIDPDPASAPVGASPDGIPDPFADDVPGAAPLPLFTAPLPPEEPKPAPAEPAKPKRTRKPKAEGEAHPYHQRVIDAWAKAYKHVRKEDYPGPTPREVKLLTQVRDAYVRRDERGEQDVQRVGRAFLRFCAKSIAAFPPGPPTVTGFAQDPARWMPESADATPTPSSTVPRGVPDFDGVRALLDREHGARAARPNVVDVTAAPATAPLSLPKV